MLNDWSKINISGKDVISGSLTPKLIFLTSRHHHLQRLLDYTLRVPGLKKFAGVTGRVGNGWPEPGRQDGRWGGLKPHLLGSNPSRLCPLSTSERHSHGLDTPGKQSSSQGLSFIIPSLSTISWLACSWTPLFVEHLPCYLVGSIPLPFPFLDSITSLSSVDFTAYHFNILLPLSSVLSPPWFSILPILQTLDQDKYNPCPLHLST